MGGSDGEGGGRAIKFGDKFRSGQNGEKVMVTRTNCSSRVGRRWVSEKEKKNGLKTVCIHTVFMYMYSTCTLRNA